MAENLEKQREATIRDFLNVVFRRKFLIIAIVVLATVIVVFLNVRQAAVFESFSRILVKRGERADIFSKTIRYLGWEEEVSSQIEVILSEAVFKRAREMLADSASVWGAGYGRRFTGGGVRADVMGESNVYLISYTDPDPVFARRACDAATKSFQEYYRIKSSPPTMSDYFANEIRNVKTQLDYWRDKKNQFLNEKMYLGMVEEGRFLLNKIGNLEFRLTELEGKVSERSVNVANLKALLPLTPAEMENRLSFSVSDHYMQSSIIRNIKFNLHNARLKKDELLNRFTEKHPKVVAIGSQIADLQNELKMEVENMYNLEYSQLQELEDKRQRIANELDQARAELDAIPDKEIQIQKINSNISILDEKYNLLLEKQDEAEIARVSSPEWEVTILSAAGPAYPKKTKDYIRIALGPFFSFIIALGIAFFFESLDHSFKHVAEVEEYLDVPVLGTISEMKQRD